MIHTPRTVHALAVALLLSAVASTTRAQASADVASLRGVRRVRLVLEQFDSDLAAVTDTTDIRIKTEFKLREHGLQVVESADQQVDATLDLQVNSVRSNELDVWALNTEVSVLQAATLSRLALHDPSATTWHDGYTIVVGGLGVERAVVDGVNSTLDSFLNAWLEANPSRR